MLHTRIWWGNMVRSVDNEAQHCRCIGDACMGKLGHIYSKDDWVSVFDLYPKVYELLLYTLWKPTCFNSNILAAWSFSVTRVSMVAFRQLFSRVHATARNSMSHCVRRSVGRLVGRSVGWSVCLSHLTFFAFLRLYSDFRMEVWLLLLRHCSHCSPIAWWRLKFRSKICEHFMHFSVLFTFVK